jgi:3-ketosteroid 9alpha-monooxygenase subunit B
MPYDKLRIARIIQETQDARSFVFEIPRDLSSKYKYKAGQFLTFRVDHPEGTFNRCYSLSSAPESDVLPKVTVKRVAGGKGSNWFHDALKEGSIMEVLPPAGRFVLREKSSPMLLFGAGSGITPLLSLIKSSLKAGDRRIRLFYANRDSTSVIFHGEIESLATAHRERLDVIHHLDAVQGVASPDRIVTATRGFEEADVYLCGPVPFMTMVEKTLLDQGIKQDHLFIERFEASGNDVVPTSDEQAGAVPEHITIHLDGKAHRVPYSRGQTILAAARLAGLDPLSSCEDGFCASCAAKRLKGDVRLAKNDVYTPQELAEGWILTCQGRCFGRDVEITYDRT